MVYTYPARNLRLFCRIARGTLAWKKAYARRTTAERSFKRKKNDYGLENARPRGKKKLLWLNILAGINQHLDASLAQTPVSRICDSSRDRSHQSLVRQAFARVPQYYSGNVFF